MEPTPALWRLRWRAQWRYFLAFPGQLLLAVLGVANGVAAIVAIDSARLSINQSFERSAEIINGSASHQIIARTGNLTDGDYVDLRRQLAWLPMAPLLEQRAYTSAGDAIRVLGVDLAKERQIRPHFGQWLNSGEIDLALWFGGAAVALVAAELQPSSSLSLIFPGQQPRSVEIVATLPPDHATVSLLVADIAAVQDWAGRAGELSAIDVMASATQAEMLAAALPGHLLLSKQDGLAGTAGLSQAFQLNLLAMGLLALLVGGFIVFNTLRFLVLQRRELFRLERMLGLTRSALSLGVLAEAAVLVSCGIVVGVVGGWLLSDLVLAQMSRTVGDLYADSSAVMGSRIAPWSVAKAAALAWLVGLAAAAWPARQLGVQVVPGARSKQGLSPSFKAWILAGLSALLVAVGLIAFSQTLLPALIGLFGLAVGYVAVATPCGLLLSRWSIGPKWTLMRYNLRRMPATLSRTAAAQAALILALATVIGVGAMIEGFRGSVASWLQTSLSADFYLSTVSDQDSLDTSVVAALSTSPEVAQVSAGRRRQVRVDGLVASLLAQTSPTPVRASYQFIEARPNLWPAFERGEGLIVSEAWARRAGLQVGQKVDLSTPKGERSLTILGVFRDYRTDGGRVVIHLDAYRRWWSDSTLTALGLYRDPAYSAEALERRLAELIAARPHGLRYAATAELRRQTLTIFDQTFTLTRALEWVAAVIAFVGVLGALLALQLERQRELSLLRALGLSRRQLGSLQLGESLVLGGVCALLSMPLGAILAHALAQVINSRAFGWSLRPDLQWNHFIAALAVGLAGASLAGLYPAWKLWRAPRRVSR